MVKLLAEVLDQAASQQRGMSRKGFVGRMTLAAAALAVAPVRFITTPVSARALTTCTIGGCAGNEVSANCPGDCSGSQSLCFSPYTTFCCTLTGNNQCPTGSIIAGWWKCSNYTGTGLCDAQNVRYYIDCNTQCTQCTTGCTACVGNPPDCSAGSFTSAVCCAHCDSQACKCANDSCGNRKTACTKFRYGQCNNDIGCVGPVRCRVVTCSYPPDVTGWHCSSVLHIDNATCCHTSSCLPSGC